MKLIETHWWALPVSDEWLVETEEDTVIITDRDEVGSLELTVLELDNTEPVHDDLRELASQLVPGDVEGEAVVCGQWKGLRYEYTDSDYCRDWLLLCEGKILLVSYTCALEHRALDDAAVDQMLGELQENKEH